MKNLERGDIISFKGHVGIYLGNGEMINALPDSGVKISKNIMNSSYWTSHFVCGFRIF
jgi:cell wall-associated NlpC family hydrolase